MVDGDGAPRTSAAKPIVELRIHGVGKQVPADVLGVDGTVPLEDISKEGETGRIWCRPPTLPGMWPVQAFMWDGLTSESPYQALWPILLPFTLLNVAGWMHPRY